MNWQKNQQKLASQVNNNNNLSKRHQKLASQVDTTKFIKVVSNANIESKKTRNLYMVTVITFFLSINVRQTL